MSQSTLDLSPLEARGLSQVVLAGVGNTEVGKLPGYSAAELQARAVHAAALDAGISTRDADAWIVHSPYATPYFFNAETLAEYFGARPNTTITLSAGAIAGTMLTVASGLLLTGQAKVVMCAYGQNSATVSKGTTGPGYHTEVPGAEFERAFGGSPAPAHYGLLAQRYLQEYQLTPEVFGQTVVAARKHAENTAGAFRREPMTMQSYEQARVVAWPLRVPDCSVITDGAGAFVVTTLDRALDLAQIPVRLLGIGGKSTHWQLSQAPALQDLGIKDSSRTAFAMAGIAVGDADVAELYDCFSIALLLQLEGMGFCGAGEGGRFVAGGGIERGTSTCPVNTDGGLLNYGHVGGMLRINEAVRQLRGQAESRQVPDARIAVASSIASWVSTHYTIVLGRD